MHVVNFWTFRYIPYTKLIKIKYNYFMLNEEYNQLNDYHRMLIEILAVIRFI